MDVENVAGSTTSLAQIQRLGRNMGRYLGETVDIHAVLEELQRSALKTGWRSDCFLRNEQFCLRAYRRPPKRHPAKRLYISAGVHGDEPAGPLAVLQLVQKNEWPDGIEVWLCPCLNPTGFALNTRENACGIDLNRQYHKPDALEVRAHVEWLAQQPSFDVSLCLHEDWEAHGFYVYELNLSQEPSMAEAIIGRVAQVCPIDFSPLIEGREAQGGVIRPSADPTSRPQWPEAFYLITHKTRRSCTLEAPSDFSLEVRVAALATGVGAVVEALAR